MSTPDGEPRAGDGPGRRRLGVRHSALLVMAVVLAAAAVVAVVIAVDARWLRLGVVAALWAALIAVTLLSRRAPARAEDGDERLEALQRHHERELSREAVAREEEVADARREAESRRGEEIAALREEVERLRSRAGANAVQPMEVRPGRLRVVGEGAPPQRTVSHRPAPVPPAERRVPLRPAAAAAPPPVHLAPPVPAGPAAPVGPPVRADRGLRADPSVVAASAFVDQYVRAAGHEPGPGGAPDAPSEAPARESRGGAANRMPASAWDSGPSATTGRTVAELLAAHAAAGGPGGRRRRDER